MAYDEAVAARLRRLLEDYEPVEKKMFGGLTFMVRGHMTIGVIGELLCARVGKPGYHEALAEPHARPMDFTGKPLTTMVYVDPPGFAGDAELADWIERCLAFNATQAPK